MPHPALTQLRALRYFAAMPPLDASARLAIAGRLNDQTL